MNWCPVAEMGRNNATLYRDSSPEGEGPELNHTGHKCQFAGVRFFVPGSPFSRPSMAINHANVITVEICMIP